VSQFVKNKIRRKQFWLHIISHISGIHFSKSRIRKMQFYRDVVRNCTSPFG